MGLHLSCPHLKSGNESLLNASLCILLLRVHQAELPSPWLSERSQGGWLLVASSPRVISKESEDQEWRKVSGTCFDFSGPV